MTTLKITVHIEGEPMSKAEKEALIEQLAQTTMHASGKDEFDRIYYFEWDTE